jgi:farnesyl-diphosphate farnesyltransferase
VGEFWTDLCGKKLPGFARRPPGEMNALGIHFGKGLQLVNILRDRQADATLGRVYVPPERLAETVALAKKYLADAEQYTKAISGRRLRAACALPFLMGRETLDLIEEFPEAPKVKISRSRVWLLLVWSLFF